jgi:M6 family metalloprotease-like protein
MLNFTKSPRVLFSGRLLLWFLLAFAWHGVAQARDAELHRLRASRRQAQKEMQVAADKAAGPALFGLLVIPVDFSDTRLPEDWVAAEQLGPRLNRESGESLRNYFAVASGSRLELRITTAPVIHLSGQRRDYSDLGYFGFHRTRALATEAIEAVRDLGLEFRSLDMEGPDRLPGSADDDGELDGVLILHAGVGQENDPETGLIQALQFYLDEPVFSGGIQASFYAVASLHSGPGIWAHETGHLLGMEDRYDPLLHPDAQGGDVRSLGGLGRFSLMASGAWGTGEGWGAALPDAYTCLQLGWFQPRYLPQAGAVADTLQPGLVDGLVRRIWTNGQIGPEFFLLETRDPESTAPFDAGLPSGQMLVYHVDESVPEGGWQDDGAGQWHLRVRLVEADNDGGLAAGQDDGRPEDFFPGPLGVDEFGPWTSPASFGYQGNSLVSLAEITSLPSAVALRASAAEEPAVTVEISFSGQPDAVLDLAVRSTGTRLDQLDCTMTATGSPTWGQFSGGGSSIDFVLVETSPGVWQPVSEVVFQLLGVVPPGEGTTFSLVFNSGAWQSPPQARTWIWQDPSGPLDFQDSWPGLWTVSHDGSLATTTWHRWVGPPYLAGDGLAVLAATGSDFVTSQNWPDVHYQNSGWVSLTSTGLGPGARAVRIIHAIESEILTPGQAMDGGRVVWVGPGGEVTEALPVDGYTSRLVSRSTNPLAGTAVFADSLLHLAGDKPTWQIDLVPLPDAPGPWRLRLEFASNSLWRYRGWFVADLRETGTNTMEAAFPVDWDAESGLRWDWSAADLPASAYQIEARNGDSGSWNLVLEDLTDQDIPGEMLLAALSTGHQTRNLVRVVALTSLGAVASRSVVVYADGGFVPGVSLGPPRPNPTLGQVQFRLEVSSGNSGTLRIYDLRGRLVHTRSYPAGSHLAVWDGVDEHGGRAAAGTYIIRLEGSGPVQSRKVVLLH